MLFTPSEATGKGPQENLDVMQLPKDKFFENKVKELE